MHRLHLFRREQGGLPQLQGLEIHPGKGLHLHGDPQGLIKGLTGTDQPMTGEKTGLAPPHRLHRQLRQLVGPEGGVGGTADVIPSRHRGHVVEGRNATVVAGQGRGMHRMAVQHGLKLGPGRQHIGMEPPLRRGAPGHGIPWASAGLDRHKVSRLHHLIGERTGCDQQTAWDPCRKIAGSALIQPRGIHATGHSHQLLPQGLFSHGHRAPSGPPRWQPPHPVR